MFRGTPLIHHLFFVDDCLLFGKASEECRHYHAFLSLYERASGQKYKFTEEQCGFCRNVHPDVKGNLGTILGVQSVEEHDRYLGLPLHVG